MALDLSPDTQCVQLTLGRVQLTLGRAHLSQSLYEEASGYLQAQAARYQQPGPAAAPPSSNDTAGESALLLEHRNKHQEGKHAGE